MIRLQRGISLSPRQIAHHRETVLLLGTSLALATGLLAGCDEGLNACTDEEVPGLEIQVRDDATGDLIVCDLVIWVIAGNYVEKHDQRCPDPPDTDPLPITRAAEERAGTYTIVVEKDGYIPGLVTNIQVEEDECHVITEEVVLRLRREDGPTSR